MQGMRHLIKRTNTDKIVTKQIFKGHKTGSRKTMPVLDNEGKNNENSEQIMNESQVIGYHRVNEDKRRYESRIIIKKVSAKLNDKCLHSNDKKLCTLMKKKSPK